MDAKAIWTERQEIERDMRDLSYRESKNPTIGGSDLMNRLATRLNDLPHVYRVPSPNLYTLKARFEKMAAKAARIVKKTGIEVAAPSYTQHDVEVVEAKRDANGIVTRAQRTYYYITIEGGTVRVPGWRFLATLEHKETENIIRRVPGDESGVDLEAFRSVKPDCEHCHTLRNRIDTFVVLREADGQVIQVGRNCLADFTGGLSPERVASWAELLFEALDDLESEPSDESWGSGGARMYHVDDLLCYSAAHIRVEGYTTSKTPWDEYRPGTASFCKDAIDRLGRYNPKNKFPETPPEITDADREHVAAAREWIANNSDGSEFMENMRVLSGETWLENRDAGMLCYLPEGYRRTLVDAERAKAKAKSVHVGTVGTRETFTATFTDVKVCDSDFGVSYLLTFVTPEGAVLKWFASNPDSVFDQAETVGKVFKFVGRVKKHDEYMGQKQTMLTRCSKFEEVA